MLGTVVPVLDGLCGALLRRLALVVPIRRVGLYGACRVGSILDDVVVEHRADIAVLRLGAIHHELAAKQGCRLLMGSTRTGLGHAAEADGLGTNSSQLLLHLVCHKAVLGTGRKGQSQNSDEGDILSSNHVSYIIYNKV